MSSSSSVVFVTVGTTRFDQLVNTVLSADVQRALKDKGFRRLVVQYGHSEVDWQKIEKGFLLPVDRYRFKPSLAADVASSSLVISHAGAGTCLEVLRAGKPLIVVVNETLMDNHQTELAEKLSEERHLRHCVCDTLLETIEDFDAKKLRPFPEGDLKAFAGFIDSVVQDLRR